MRKNVLDRSFKREEILKRLREYASDDADPYGGRLFTISYETGVEELKEIAYEALKLFL